MRAVYYAPCFNVGDLCFEFVIALFMCATATALYSIDALQELYIQVEMEVEKYISAVIHKRAKGALKKKITKEFN